MPVRVRDLKNQTGEAGPRPILRCFDCGEEFSANAGDYFKMGGRTVLVHCGKPLRLVLKRTIFESVSIF